ncbi:hypothetical protein QTN25_003677 [Entamoeba marina]
MSTSPSDVQNKENQLTTKEKLTQKVNYLEKVNDYLSSQLIIEYKINSKLRDEVANNNKHIEQLEKEIMASRDNALNEIKLEMNKVFDLLSEEKNEKDKVDGTPSVFSISGIGNEFHSSLAVNYEQNESKK